MRRFALLLVLVATPAHADDPALAEARRLEAQLDYEPALVIVEQLIARGDATREQLVERHLLAGKLAAGLERRDVAQAHFKRVLELAPDTTLPAGTSPKITEPFEAARAQTVRPEPPVVVAPIATVRTPFYRQWTVWAGAGTFALAVGGLAGWRFSVAQNDWNDLDAAGGAYDDLRAIEKRGRRWGLAANISFGVAAAAGLTAVLCYVTRTEAPPVAVSASSTSIDVGVGWSF